MTTIYYFVGVLFLIYEVISLINIQESHRKLVEFKLFTKENPNIRFDDYPEDMKKYILWKAIVIFPLLIWLFTGLLTSQWYIFLGLLLMDFVVFNIVRRIIGASIIRLYLHIVVNATYIIAILFILLNKFHLHLSFEQVLELFK